MNINWERARQEAFTTIRADFTVDTLVSIELEDNYTPVSGDALAIVKYIKKWMV